MIARAKAAALALVTPGSACQAFALEANRSRRRASNGAGLMPALQLGALNGRQAGHGAGRGSYRAGSLAGFREGRHALATGSGGVNPRPKLPQAGKTTRGRRLSPRWRGHCRRQCITALFGIFRDTGGLYPIRPADPPNLQPAVRLGTAR